MFTRKETVVAPETTGTSVLRAAARSHRFKGHFATLSRDLGVSVAMLEEFVDSGKPLPEPILQKLAKELFNAELDITKNQLRKLDSPQPQPLGLIPEPCAQLPVGSGYPPVPDPKARSGFSPGPPPGKPFPKRPGWV